MDQRQVVLKVIRLDDISRQLDTPFVMQQIARVDHFGVFLYLCHGFVQRHQHTTQDELFYVYRGILSMDTDWGTAALSDHELTVIPRGLNHGSGAAVPTIILFFQAIADPERRNGHGRLGIGEERHALPTRSVAQEAALINTAYLPLPIGQVDEMSLRLVRCSGVTPWYRHDEHDELLWVYRGAINLLADLGPVRLRQDEMVVVPRGSSHRIYAPEDALVISFIHGHVSPLQQMGYDEGR